jgi:hypothetical protein
MQSSFAPENVKRTSGPSTDADLRGPLLSDDGVEWVGRAMLVEPVPQRSCSELLRRYGIPDGCDRRGLRFRPTWLIRGVRTGAACRDDRE